MNWLPDSDQTQPWKKSPDWGGGFVVSLGRLLAIVVLAMALVVPVYAESTNADKTSEVQPTHLEGYGLTASRSGNVLTADGYTDGYNNNWVENVSVKFYVYRIGTRGRRTLVQSSPEYFDTQWYVTATWSSSSLAPGAYEVRARHREYTVDGDADTWSIYPMCFSIE